MYTAFQWASAYHGVNGLDNCYYDLWSDEKSGDNLLAFDDDDNEQTIEEIKRQQDEEFGDFLRRHGQSDASVKKHTGQAS